MSESHYEISMSQENAKKAILNYLDFRKKRINAERKAYIHKLMQPRKTFYGLITLPPKFNNVRDCIRYMKSNSDCIFGTIWSDFALTGSTRSNIAKDLLMQIDSGNIQGDIRLSSSMAYLANWVE